jgi:8-oxo-dGTP pyrophosphatase MutT (NUDIX family)
VVVEETINSQVVYDGKLVNLRVDTVRLPDGSERQREVVEHPGAVGILPVLPDEQLVLVRQYRHAVGRMLLEIPAGTREPGEGPEACAIRELREETGCVTPELKELVRFFVSPGWATEELIVYLATDVTGGPAAPEADEMLEVVQVRPDTVVHLIRSGEIADSKTIIALLAFLGVFLPAV